MRKRLFLAALAAIVGTATAIAQQIAVVSEGGSTDVYQTLTEAIEGADPGSVIYLPGGGFQIHDSVKITKRLTIIGIGHKAKNENADGNTTIAGNLFFEGESSGSSVLGCYITGNVNVGGTNVGVTNFLLKYCNVNSVQVKNNLSTGLIVNQNYIRNKSVFNGANASLSNNIVHSVCNINGGKIKNNIITSYSTYKRGEYGLSGSYDIFSKVIIAYNSTIDNNVILSTVSVFHGSECLTSGNMLKGSWGDDCVNIGEADWNAVFTKYNGGAISPASDFHFTEEYQQYSDCGIYGGDGFSDGQLPPVPFIVAKSIPEQTDAAGNLNIKIRVKAGE